MAVNEKPATVADIVTCGVEMETGEYTEVALDCLDLKAQEELLSPSLSGHNNILQEYEAS